MYIWYTISLLFFLININILINESYELIYNLSYQSEPLQYLNCFNLKEIFINKTRINLIELKTELNQSLKWLQINKVNRFAETISSNLIEKINHKTELKSYLIYRDQICFIFDTYKDFKSFYYFYANSISSNYAFKNDGTFSLQKINYQTLIFIQISVHHKEYPYSNCVNGHSNFKCLNNKIKRIQNLSKYYYESNEIGFIELNYQINQTIIDNEIKTIKECSKYNDCKITYFFFSQDDLNSIILTSNLFISKFDFYFQIIGLISLFTGNTIYDFINRFIKFSFSKLPNLSKLSKLKSQIISLKLKIETIIKLDLKLVYFIFLIVSICLLLLYNQAINDYIDEQNNPSLKTLSINSFESEMSIAICTINSVEYKNKRSNKSLFELENYTNSELNSTIKDIYLDYLDEKIKIKWQLRSELVFFENANRCFQLRILLKESKYQSLISAIRLIIEFNRSKYGYVYILNNDELLNSNSYLFKKENSIFKKIVKRSKSNRKCTIYNVKDDNCINKWNCIDQCINRLIYNQIKNVSIHSFIDKNHFTDQEWKNLYFNYLDINRFDYKDYKKLCSNKYSNLNCYNVEIKSGIQSDIGLDKLKIELDLYYEIIYHKEEDQSIFKLLMNLLNIQSNLIGLNLFKLILIILALIRLELKEIFKFIIYIICLIGFIYHLWSIYDEIINIEIIYSEHYELINTIKMPDLIFCFNINQTKIDPNYKLTYEYLDKITEELSEDKIFYRIEYLNRSIKWIKLNYETNYKDGKHFKIEQFYFLNKKCFKLIQNIEYNRNQLLFQNYDEYDNNYNEYDNVLKIFFNWSILGGQTFYFFTKTKNKMQFSKVNRLILNEFYPGIYKFYQIKHEIIQRDEFELIKNPLSLFNNDLNDIDKFFNKLLDYFENQLNLLTFYLPFNRTDLNLNYELDDHLFFQLFEQQQKHFNLTNNLIQYSVNRLFFFYYSNFNTPDIEFNLSFYRKIIVVSNKISLIKLIINLLNVLSFWFDLGILDLYIYFYRIKLLPIFLYNLLIKFKNQLIINF